MSAKSGLFRILIVAYGVLALAALGRSGYQIAVKFSEAPLAYSLSAVAAVVYLVATIALLVKRLRPLAYAALVIELLGVLTVGTLSLIVPDWFGGSSTQATVWTFYGMGYLFIPLFLPALGLWWLSKSAPEK